MKHIPLLKLLIPKKIVTTVTFKIEEIITTFDLHWFYTGKFHGKHRILLYHESYPTKTVSLVERYKLHDTIESLYHTIILNNAQFPVIKNDFVTKVLISIPPEYLDLIRNQ